MKYLDKSRSFFFKVCG